MYIYTNTSDRSTSQAQSCHVTLLQNHQAYLITALDIKLSSISFVSFSIFRLKFQHRTLHNDIFRYTSKLLLISQILQSVNIDK